MIYVYDRRLALYGHGELRFREDDVQIPSLEIAGNGNSYVHILDRLRPFVGQLGLFFRFLRADFGVISFALGWGRRRSHGERSRNVELGFVRAQYF